MSSPTMQRSDSTKAFQIVATVVALLGALNWGLIGLFDWNLVDAIFGGGAVETTSSASRVIYAVIGLSGIISLILMPNLMFSAKNVRPDL